MNAAHQYEASRRKTKIHAETIRSQEQNLRERSSDGLTQKEIKKEDRKSKAKRRKQGIEQLKIPENLKAHVEQARDDGASSWLNALPIKD